VTTDAPKSQGLSLCCDMWYYRELKAPPGAGDSASAASSDWPWTVYYKLE